MAYITKLHEMYHQKYVNIIDLPSVSPLERFQFYLNACKDDIHCILEIQNSGKDVICDRLLDSTIISHKILDPSIGTKSAEIINNSLQKIQILLIAPLKIIQQRLRDRGQVTRFEADLMYLNNLQNAFLQCHNHLVLNTRWSIQNTVNSANYFINI